ncbi:MAG: integrase [Alphaproteobacteria bacterium]|jgi:integrase
MTDLKDEFIRTSRQAFHSVRGPTLSEVRAAITDDGTLDRVQRRDLLSALSRIERHTRQQLSDIPATAAAVREICAATNAVRMSISEKSFRNIRSAASMAVRRYGGAPAPITTRIPLTGEWQDLLAMIPFKTMRFSLNRLAAFCSHMGIAPGTVDQTTLTGFYEALDAEVIVKNPKKLAKHTAICWNRCSREIEGWPQSRLEGLFKRTPYTFPLAAFPKSFQDDVANWRKRMEAPDLLDLDAPARPLRPDTIKVRIVVIRRFASALVHRREMSIEEITSLGSLMDPARFKSALRFFLDRLGGEPTESLQSLANAMRHIANHWCKVDEETLKQLAKLCKRLEPAEQPHLSQKKRARLQQFEDPENVRRLLCFPENQVAKAKREKNPMKGARRVERALIVAILIHCALRQRTLRMLEVSDFRWDRTSAGIRCHLLIAPEKVKNRRELEFALPAETVEILRLYLETYRPMLPGSDGPYLIPGMNGGMRSQTAMTEAIVPVLRKETGLEINPHLIRDIVAKIAIERDPAAYGAVTHLLGHKSEAVTRQHYLGSETKAAAQFLDGILTKARHGEHTHE